MGRPRTPAPDGRPGGRTPEPPVSTTPGDQTPPDAPAEHDATSPGDPGEVHDEVDRIVAAWERERPDLDVTPLTVLSRVSRLARHLDLARRGVFARHGLETWEFDVLSALRREGSPYRLSPGALLTQTLVTSGTMTNRIDRLAQRGLVARMPSPDDRRGVLVELTGLGRERVDGALADLLDEERTLLTGLPDEDRARLADLLRSVVAPFDAP